MVKKKKSNFFWVSYSDLMTSLFFIVLVLFVLTYVNLKRQKQKIENEKEALQEQVDLFNRVKNSLDPLKRSDLFEYDDKYERFTLSFDVKFKSGQSRINYSDLENPQETIEKIDNAGETLYNIIDSLDHQRKTDTSFSKVSYLLIISGYASNFGENIRSNYVLSYNRALNLWDYWNTNGFDFENPSFQGVIDLQISGNGIGGVGRFEGVEESKNQRFIIQLVPKVGNLQD